MPLPVWSLLYRGGLGQALSDWLRRSWFRCHSQGPRFSSGSALWPSHDGIRRMRRTNLPRRPCRKTYGRYQDSKRNRLIHRPCGDIAPPIGGIQAFSSCSMVQPSLSIRRDERHKWSIGGTVALVCSVALSGQAPKPHRGAAQARGLTANAPSEQSSVLSRCASLLDTPSHAAAASFVLQ